MKIQPRSTGDLFLKCENRTTQKAEALFGWLVSKPVSQVAGGLETRSNMCTHLRQGPVNTF